MGFLEDVTNALFMSEDVSILFPFPYTNTINADVRIQNFFSFADSPRFLLCLIFNLLIKLYSQHRISPCINNGKHVAPLEGWKKIVEFYLASIWFDYLAYIIDGNC